MRRNLSAGLAAALFFVAGCATSGNSSTSMVEQTRVTGGQDAAIVMTYQTGSAEEEAGRAKLALQDAAARVELARLLEAAQRASAVYHNAAEIFSATLLPPEVVRPTKEQVDAFRKEATAAWAVVTKARANQVDKYRAFLNEYPKNWHVRHRLAWFMADHHLRHEAAEEWRQVIKLEPRFPYAYNNLGSLYNHMGRDMEAIDLFLKAIALESEDPTFHTNLAANYAVHKDEVAEKFGWSRQKVFREIIACYAKAQELAPQDKEIAWNIATQYVVASRFGLDDTADGAIAAWKRYLTLELTQTERAIASRNMGRIFLREKHEPAVAVNWLEQAVKLSDDPTSRMLLKQARAALPEASVKE